MSPSDKEIDITNQSKRGGKIKWIVGGILMLFAVAAAMNLPRGYSDDLSRTGQGIPAIILIRDKNAVQTFELMNAMDSVRSQYSGKVEFLLTDFNTTEGRKFMEINQAGRATLVLLDASGKKVNILGAPQTKESLQKEIADSFGINP